MGVDLKLLPFYIEGFSLTVLTCERWGELFEAISNIESTVIPSPFNSYLGDDGYGKTSHDAYGSPLRAVTAGQLSKLKEHPSVLRNDINFAVWAYLNALHPDVQVALYWC